jgi:hypothetical protein
MSVWISTVLIRQLFDYLLYCFKPVNDQIIAEKVPTGAFAALDAYIYQHEGFFEKCAFNDPAGERRGGIETQFHVASALRIRPSHPSISD